MSFCRFLIPVAALVWIGTQSGSFAVSEDSVRSERVSFDQQIRPILSDTCFQCHGPDEKNREADLRLDRKDSAFEKRAGHRVVVPKKPLESDLYLRVSTDDSDERMPPADSGRSLSEDDIELIRRWIEQGAEWQEHWAFVRPQSPELPRVSQPEWCDTEIDRFILARLDREGLRPSPEADRATLIRRVTLDLPGLPPTPAEVDVFVPDESPKAWENLVDRLLDSEAYGERMAVRWLDLARYADTSGYQTDGARDMWRWRDWVISAYNSNMTFDQFTIEQLAGDLLQDIPLPGRLGYGGLQLDGLTLNRLIATGFNRNHRGNSEGGVVPEEFQVEYVADRVDTTATVWLGLTMQCARCHDHKYDPISQREFYQVFACFNNIPEYGRYRKDGNSHPYIKAPTDEQRQQLASLNRELDQLQGCWDRYQNDLTEARRKWEPSTDAQEAADLKITEGLVAHFPLDGGCGNLVEDSSRDGKSTTSPAFASAAATTPTSGSVLPVFVAGRIGEAAQFDGKQSVLAKDTCGFDYLIPFSATAWIHASGDGTVVSRITASDPQGTGWSVSLQDGHVHVGLINRWLDDCVRLESVERVPKGEWHHIGVTYDGSRQAGGVEVYIDGHCCEKKIHFDFLNQTFAAPAEDPVRIGGGVAAFHGLIDEVRLYDRCLDLSEVLIASNSDAISEIARIPPDVRTPAQMLKVRTWFVLHRATQAQRDLYSTLVRRQRERTDFVDALPTVMVMHESHPRKTHVLTRGVYDQPGESVDAGVPGIFPPLEDAQPANRLGLAKWLVSGNHPLTARVAVNRYWQMYFGEGLVRSMEDFGSQGRPPSHPDLLDWLAMEFVDGGWNVKQMQKAIVMSATYRQSSRTSPKRQMRDPENLLLARGPRFRLTAEMVRDQALAACGILHECVGGPSVKPYQPDGIWSEIATTTEYDRATGSGLYRRSLYTYWKRTVVPPSMLTFDATSRELCTVRRARTNTPLQALILMNDVTFVEAARVLGQRMLLEGGTHPDEKIAWGFRLVLARTPQAVEAEVFRKGLDRNLERFHNDIVAAKQLTSIGESVPPGKLDPADLAAYTTVASLILNLDETVTRN